MVHFVRTLELAAVLAHMSLGCCLHHARAQVASSSEASALHAGCCGHEHRGRDHSPAPHEKTPSQRCCDHEHCSFVPPEMTGAPRVTSARQPFALAASLPEATTAASQNAIDGRYVWLPIEFTKDEKIILRWYDKWDLTVFDKLKN